MMAGSSLPQSVQASEFLGSLCGETELPILFHRRDGNGGVSMGSREKTYKGMSLFTVVGERKYLCPKERARFLDCLNVLKNPRDRTFCAMLHWTGCRPSEALALTAMQIDCDLGAVIIGSLKKRGRWKDRHFRSVPVPVPGHFIEMLDAVHGIRAAQAEADHGKSSRLWTLSRTTAFHRVRSVMQAAGLSGTKASAKGLRHAYGVHAALSQIPETRIKAWLGHASLETTEIYLDTAGPEDQTIAERMW